MSNDNDTKNIFKLVSGMADEPDTETLPTDTYVIVTHDDEEFVADGFLLFTSHHLAVMRDTGKGAKPVLVVPLQNVKMAEIAEDDTTT